MTLHIERLEFETIIGLLPREREAAQRVEVWAQIEVEEGGTAPDEIVDYVTIIELIQTTMRERKFFTLEEALEDIGKRISAVSTKICAVFIKIMKPDIIANAVVGVSAKKFFKKS
jgi:dihydroneopterin aldolase